ncbi:MULTISPECIES: hypothetical protein [Acidiplasma]|uniref:hypothetical protein n=1 Tax=Acidiplasma TaxID=507753 RepID=UPI000AD4F09D|nr:MULTISPECIES: hypothetical protein [Acidiplasma]WMT54917.1 MAG: hypothetical protein RE470_08380 [Acidiplasma sp.]
MKNHKIETSEVTYIELMLLAKKYDLDLLKLKKTLWPSAMKITVCIFWPQSI